jgi:hypothetical protein
MLEMNAYLLVLWIYCCYKSIITVSILFLLKGIIWHCLSVVNLHLLFEVLGVGKARIFQKILSQVINDKVHFNVFARCGVRLG